MGSTRISGKEKLPGKFEDLMLVLPPRAIADEVHYENTVEMIDRLMAIGRLTKGQSLYLETLVQLVQAYESSNHAIDVSDLSGIDTLKYLLEENGMNASDLARLLGVHVSLGSKILKGDRSLTVDHVKTLAERFKVSAGLFLD
ncbi:MAG: helix-turn-helix domain-containing protein [Candidatus Omnitrophica bacterium]|nr:helix-turn-helix domain-containing protein [Candidatus Omnitrophota bacterium]